MSIETIKLGASNTIGSHILPGEPLIKLGNTLKRKIKLTVLNCDDIIKGINEKVFDFGLIESPIFDDDLVYKKWMEDELVFCSKAFLGEYIDEEIMSRSQLLCRVVDCPTRKIIANFFMQEGLSYTSFDSLMQVDNSTSAIQGIKWSKPDKEHPTVAIVSKYAIKDELERKELYAAQIQGKPIIRNFYLIYGKEHAEDELYQVIESYLKEWGKTA